MGAAPLRLLGEPGQPVFFPHDRPTFMSVERRQQLAAPVAGIIVAAGSGARLGAGVPKALIEVGGRPLWRWAADALLAGGCGRLVIVAPSGSDNDIQLDGAPVVPGGATRQQSVALGLEALADDPPYAILVHDAARALTPSAVVARVVAAVRAGHKVVTPVVPVADTVRQLDEAGDSSVLVRDRLRAVQTPQGFDYATLMRAHAEASAAGFEATDDVALCERLGEAVYLVDGDPMAFKITTPMDLEVAQALGKG